MRQRLGGVCLTIALGTLVAACGSSGSSSTTTTAGAGTTNAARLVGARVAAAKCLRGQGLDVPDPTSYVGNPSGYLKAVASVDVNSPAFKTTGKTCKALALKEAGG